jgi:Domain of unknown function (DUF4838)/Carbohydrate-binding family 9
MILNSTTGGRVRVYALCDEAAKGFIADEIALHLTTATGVAHPLPERIQKIDDAPAQSILLILDPDLGREAYDCNVDDGHVRIRGGDARGLYYGVLAFLEYLGFRWYAPSDIGTVNPKLAQVSVAEDWHAAGAPSLLWRGYHICGTGWTKDGKRMGHFDYETALWMARNRMNFKPIHNDEYDEMHDTLDELLLSPLAFGHSYGDWLPDSMFETHPEYFPLIAGKRQKRGQCCVSNPEVRNHFIKEILKYIESHPRLPIISIAPNDGYRFCQCDDCMALDTESDKANKEINRRHHLFSAALAKAVGEKYPDVKLGSIGYCNYLDPADDVQPEDSLAVSLCITRAQNHPLDAQGSPSNEILLNRLNRWTEKAGSVFWSAYYLSYGGTFPRPYRQQVVQTLRLLAEKGVAGIKSEVTPGRFERWQSAVFFMYLIAKTSYDVNTDPDKLLEEFCRTYYGRAWESCLQYYQLNESLMARYKGDITYMGATLIPKLYSEGDTARLQEMMDKAKESLADADPVYLKRLQPLLKQANEIAVSRREVLLSEAEAGPLDAPHLNAPPTFKDFDRLKWMTQRIRSNRLPFPTSGQFAVAWTDESLYLCFRMEEPDMAKARSQDGLNQGVWGGSLVDCFLSPDPDSGVYFQVAANLFGRAYTARCKEREWDNDYDVSEKVQVQYVGNRWEMIIALPFDRLGMASPASGKRMRLAMNRGQTCQSPRTLGGWPRGGSWHKIETMGELIFRREP